MGASVVQHNMDRLKALYDVLSPDMTEDMVKRSALAAALYLTKNPFECDLEELVLTILNAAFDKQYNRVN